jgi:hypothetical protein
LLFVFHLLSHFFHLIYFNGFYERGTCIKLVSDIMKYYGILFYNYIHDADKHLELYICRMMFLNFKLIEYHYLCSFIGRLILIFIWGRICSEIITGYDNKKLAVPFNHTFRYISNVLSINNHTFHNYVHLIYPDELEIKDTTKYDKCASYLAILLNIDSNGTLTTSRYVRRNDFQFAIVNFSFLCSNILICVYHSWFDMQEHVLRMRTFQNEANYLQKSWCCKVIKNLV